MKGSLKVAKGRFEEAAGVLTNNDKLRVKGQREQTIGRVKQAAEAGVSKAKDKASKIMNKAKKVAKRTVDKAKG